MQIPDNISEIVTKRVHRDLRPGPVQAGIKMGGALALGGGLSLFLCGQFGMGLTTAARSFNHAVHHQMGPIVCALVCGCLFAVVPIGALRLVSSPLEFRALMRQRWDVQALWILIFGGLLSYHGQFGFEFVAVLVWVVGAFAVFQALGRIIDLIGVVGSNNLKGVQS